MDIELNSLWFLLVAVLFTGFFFLEGFDYGVGTLLPFLGKNDQERRQIINTIGPFWDGNEVWLLTAGGAIFAAFPHWYATLFSGFYLALFLILVALIVRAVAFEFRSKDDNPRWRKTWDWAIFFGSAVPALLWGVAIANIVRGVPIDENMTFTGNFFDLLNPYSLLGGLVTLGLFTLHGALFLELKSSDIIRERASDTARKLWIPVVVVVLAFVGYSLSETALFDDANLLQYAALVGAVVALVGGGVMVYQGRQGWAFVGTALAITFVVILIFNGLYPRVMPSSTNVAFDLTIYNASSSDYTLKIMTIVTLIFLPMVLVYQGWTYWVFRQRVKMDSELEY
jgi:cytochrome bd ubiquinol oxidase subunit II